MISRSDNVESEYIRGVTPQTTSFVDDAYKSATSDKCQTRAKEAYYAFCKQVKIWQAAPLMSKCIYQHQDSADINKILHDESATKSFADILPIKI